MKSQGAIVLLPSETKEQPPYEQVNRHNFDERFLWFYASWSAFSLEFYQRDISRLNLSTDGQIVSPLWRIIYSTDKSPLYDGTR